MQHTSGFARTEGHRSPLGSQVEQQLVRDYVRRMNLASDEFRRARASGLLSGDKVREERNILNSLASPHSALRARGHGR
jgi:hypothetical protein